MNVILETLPYRMALVFDIASVADFWRKASHICIQISGIIDLGDHVSQTPVSLMALLNMQGTDTEPVTE